MPNAAVEVFRLFLIVSRSLGLRQDPVQPYLQGGVAITFDASRILGKTRSRTANLNLNVTNGNFVSGFTVPGGERWRIVVARKAATTTSTSILIRVAGDDIAFVSGDTATAENWLPAECYLEEGDEIGLKGNAQVADASVRFDVVYVATVGARQASLT